MADDDGAKANTLMVDYAQLSQDYALPGVVKIGLDAAIKQAEAIAIVMALFAGALVSFAQMVNGVNSSPSDTSSVSWGAMLVFLYGAIMLSMGGSFISLIVIKMCSDLPLVAQQKILNETAESGILSRVAAGATLSRNDLAHHFKLLEKFGMSPAYKVVVRASNLILIATSVCTFASLTFWVFLSESRITAGVTMVFFGVTAITIIGAYIIAGQKWS